MKITIRNRNLPVTPSFDSQVEAALLALGSRHRLDEANVLLERVADASPPYRVLLQVAVPGPDVHREITDHSAMRAFSKAIAEVEESLRSRSARRAERNRRRALRTAGARMANH